MSTFVMPFIANISQNVLIMYSFLGEKAMFLWEQLCNPERPSPSPSPSP